MIAIVDYGMGNIKAFADVYKKLNIPAVIVRSARELENAGKIILPGVGSFDYVIKRIEESGMRSILDDVVIHRHVPVLGICMGMQIFAFSSEEGNLPGLGWINGKVKRLTSSSREHPISVPHMGWNNAKPVNANAIFQGLDSDARFYFLHSYYFECDNHHDVMAFTEYGGDFASAVNSGNIYGVQFHPEKSHQWGIKLLENFARL